MRLVLILALLNVVIINGISIRSSPSAASNKKIELSPAIFARADRDWDGLKAGLASGIAAALIKILLQPFDTGETPISLYLSLPTHSAADVISSFISYHLQ